MSTLGREPARRAINANDIPDNSINASKIIDGSISAADVSSDLVTLTGSQSLTNKTLTTPTIADMSNCTFPVGSVVQTVTSRYYSSSGHLHIASTTYTETHTDLRVTITPKYSNSEILLQWFISGQNECGWCKVKLLAYDSSSWRNLKKSGGSEWPDSYYGMQMKDAENDSWEIVYSDFPGTTNQQMYNAWGCGTQAQNMYFPHQNTLSCGMAMEIKR